MHIHSGSSQISGVARYNILAVWLAGWVKNDLSKITVLNQRKVGPCILATLI